MLELEQRKRLIEHMGGRWWLPQRPLASAPPGLSWQDVSFERLEKNDASLIKDVAPLKKEPLLLKETPALKRYPSLAVSVPAVSVPEAVSRHSNVSSHAVDMSERIELHLYLHRVGQMLFLLEHEQWEVLQLAQKESNLLLDIRNALRLLLKADTRFFENATEQVMHFDWPRVMHAKLSLTQQDAFSAVEGLIHSITRKDNIKFLLFFGQKSMSYVHPLHQKVADFDIYRSPDAISIAFLPSLSTLMDTTALKKELWVCLKKLVITL